MVKKNKLKVMLSETYGFDKALICNLRICKRKDIDYIVFEVNDIRYCVWKVHDSAFPQLKVLGYTYKFYENKTPVTKKYYDEQIK